MPNVFRAAFLVLSFPILSTAVLADTLTQPTKIAQKFINDNKDGFATRPDSFCGMPADTCTVIYTMKPGVAPIIDDDMATRAQMRILVQKCLDKTIAPDEMKLLLAWVAKTLLTN